MDLVAAAVPRRTAVRRARNLRHQGQPEVVIQRRHLGDRGLPRHLGGSRRHSGRAARGVLFERRTRGQQEDRTLCEHPASALTRRRTIAAHRRGLCRRATPRRREKRYWEDVQIGDALTPVAKGPLTMVDVIAMHMGLGLSSSGIGPLRFNWRQRSRMPAFYVAGPVRRARCRAACPLGPRTRHRARVTHILRLWANAHELADSPGDQLDGR